MQPQYHVDWTTAHTHEWLKALAPFIGKPRLEALEIGVLEGRSTMWFCDNILTDPTSHITCIDPFLQVHEPRFTFRREGFDEAVQLFSENTKAHQKKIHLFRGRSCQFFAMRQIAVQMYDFCYIDGSHTIQDAATDLFWCFALLKVGGVMIVDDYAYTDVIEVSPGDLIMPGVKQAVEGLLVAVGNQLEVLHKDWQIILRKTS